MSLKMVLNFLQVVKKFLYVFLKKIQPLYFSIVEERS